MRILSDYSNDRKNILDRVEIRSSTEMHGSNKKNRSIKLNLNVVTNQRVEQVAENSEHITKNINSKEEIERRCRDTHAPSRKNKEIYKLLNLQIRKKLLKVCISLILLYGTEVTTHTFARIT